VRRKSPCAFLFIVEKPSVFLPFPVDGQNQVTTRNQAGMKRGLIPADSYGLLSIGTTKASPRLLPVAH